MLTYTIVHAEVSSDHPLLVTQSDANSVEVANIADDVLYYAEDPGVGPADHMGTLNVGESATFAGASVWVRSASTTSVICKHQFGEPDLESRAADLQVRVGRLEQQVMGLAKVIDGLKQPAEA